MADMRLWMGVTLFALMTTACESDADRCKKACYDEVKVCESMTDEAKKIRCEADQTESAITCAEACDK